MSVNDDRHDDQRVDDQPVDDAIDATHDAEADKKKNGAAAWMISAAVHGVLIAVAAFAVFGAPKILEQDAPPTRVNAIDPPVKEKEKPKEKRELEAKVELEAPTEVDVPSPTNTLDVPTEVAEHEADSANPNPKGREEAVADSETGGSGAFMAIGAGGGSAGIFGNRSGGGRKRAVGKGGGSRGSEGAVEASLRWLKRHQSPDGKWDAVKYFQNCTEGAKCEPGKYWEGKAAQGEEDIHAAMTGYALLCFLGAGYDHKTPNIYKSTVKKGLEWLLSAQKPDGLLGIRNYAHPIAVMALAEAYAMTADPALRGPAQKGIDAILARQNRCDGGKDSDRLGWDYNTSTKRNDSSVTGWNIMALKSGLAAGLNIGRGMDGAKTWLEESWHASNETAQGAFKAWKNITAYDQSRFAYVWNTGDTGFEPGHGWWPAKPASAYAGRSLESVGLVCGVFLGRTSGDTLIESLANSVMEYQMPSKYPCNTYYMYYNTMAIFQMGGDRWTKWNGVVRDMLVNAQRKSNDCFDGSWDWEGTVFPGYETGRVLSTVYNTLCLEVYYRYAQVKNLHGMHKP